MGELGFSGDRLSWGREFSKGVSLGVLCWEISSGFFCVEMMGYITNGLRVLWRESLLWGGERKDERERDRKRINGT